MGRRGPKPWQPVPADVIVCEFRLPPFRRKRQRRRPDSCDLLDDGSVMGLGAEWFELGMRRAVPMPRGGFRHLVQCPNCTRWVLRLYATDWAGGHGRDAWRCRHCLGLHYTSEYAGRRPEASRARVVALVESIRYARYVHTRARRTERLMMVIQQLHQREARWLERFIASTPKWMTREVEKLPTTDRYLTDERIDMPNTLPSGGVGMRRLSLPS